MDLENVIRGKRCVDKLVQSVFLSTDTRYLLLHASLPRRALCVSDAAADSRDYKENGETKTETTYTYSEFFLRSLSCVECNGKEIER